MMSIEVLKYVMHVFSTDISSCGNQEMLALKIEELGKMCSIDEILVANHLIYVPN